MQRVPAINSPRSALAILMCGGTLLFTVGAPRLAAMEGIWSATVYVSRHFEVREHNQTTKYVVVNGRRVAQVTGSISSRDRLQRIRLNAGWNLCSIAVSGPFSTTGPEGVIAAYLFDTPSGGYTQLSPGQTLTAGSVIWIKAQTNLTITLRGTYSEPTPRMIQSPGVYVGGAGLEAWSPKLPENISLWEYDSGNARWQDNLTTLLTMNPRDQPLLDPGQAAYLNVPTAITLDVPDPALRVRYFHLDHLGSSSALTDANGALVEETAYLPFGIPRTDFQPRALQAAYQYTQAERDLESGLENHEVRYFNGILGKFVSVDHAYANPDSLSTNVLTSLLAHPQSLSSYDYARNNPLRWIDRIGLAPGDPFKTADDAAVDVLTWVNNLSIVLNVEYGGWIYQDPKSGSFYATVPIQGSETGTEWKGSTSLVPNGSKFVGKFHTHGDYSTGHYVSDPAHPGDQIEVVDARTSDPKTGMFSGDQFSPPDLTVGMLNSQKYPGWSEYLGTPSGDFLSSSGRREKTIGHLDRPYAGLPPAEAKKALDFANEVMSWLP